MADLLVEVMYQAGVCHAFAMPAESLNPILDAMRKSGRVQLITVRHEGNGALMASACAKLTGRPSVCMGAAGPGASHLPLGTYDAKADGAPVLAITGQVPIHQVGTGAFQEIDSLGLLDDSVVFNRLVASPQQTALVPLACAQAIYRRAPVHLAFPSDVLGTRIDSHVQARFRPEWLVPGRIQDKNRIRQAACRLSGGGCAVVIVGGGVGGNLHGAVEAVAGILRAPILVASEGIHYLREQSSAPVLRMGARENDPALNLARSAGKIVIVGTVGASIYARFSPSARVVQIAPPEEIGRPESDRCVRVLGEIEETLTELASQISATGDRGMLERAREIAAAEKSQTSQSMKDFWAVLSRELPADGILALEPGQIFESAFFNLCLCRRTVTTSFNHGARGYAFPAAVAAGLVYPDRSAWAVASQPGLAESMPELLSAQKHSIPVRMICLGPAGRNHAPAINFRRYALASGYQVFEANDAASLAQAVRQAGQKALPSIICAAWEASVPAQPYEIYDPPVASPASVTPTLGACLIGALHRAGVRRIYGPVRPSVERFLEKLREDGRIRFVAVAHAESAAMMASAYSKWTRKPGVCLIGDQQDLPFQLNGLYDAAFDRNPVIILTLCDAKEGCLGAGNPPLNARRLLGDIVALSDHLGPTMEAFQRLQHSLRKAVQLRTVNHVCFDCDALDAPCPDVSLRLEPASAPESLLPPAEILSQAATRLATAKRPVILAGRGAQGAQKEIRKIAELLSAPIVCTMPGRGVADEFDQFVGGIGASGHRVAIEAVRKSDVLLVLGSSNRGAVFGLRGKFFLIQVDSDPLQLGQRPNESLGLYGTTKETIQELINLLAAADGAGAVASDVRARKRAFNRSRFVKKYRSWFVRKLGSQQVASKGAPIPPAAICHALSEALAELDIGRPIVTLDVGVTTLWVYRHLVGNFDFIWTSSFATMGFALPAAIAIRELEPSRPVIGIAGDGGIGITMSELATATRLGLPIVIIIFNNSKLSAIKYEQEVMGWPEYQSGLFNCDFAEYARACGAQGIRVTQVAELQPALRKALTGRAPCVVDVVCDPHAMPAPPRIHPLQAAGYLLAVSREAGQRLGKLLGRGQGRS
jgi:thiamine pyrophosphate-dependent acetolactate synthase large subunit-like protein